MIEGLLYKGQSVIETIKRRTSIRTYKAKPLDSEKDELKRYFDSIEGIFDVPVRFILVDNKMKDESLRLGTYGIIKNPPAFILGIAEKRDNYMEQLGYKMEKAVLYATSMGLGTCWMAGSFNRGEFAKAAGLKDNEELVIVSPVGTPEENRRLLDKLMRLAAGSKDRKEWKELFFKGSFEKALGRDDAGVYGMPLEMVRMAPSASNKQPWKVVMEDKYFHFFLKHAKGYDKALGYDIQKVDLGIAMCHFELSSKELGLEGAWISHKPSIKGIPGGTEYIISWEKK